MRTLLSHPLQWPVTVPRTNPDRRRSARFASTFAAARDLLISEVKRLRGSQLVITSNLELTADGYPRRDRKSPEDPGVAVYFQLTHGRVCIPCDVWLTPDSNLYAIKLTVEAFRGINRWVNAGLVNTAFSGFAALPAAAPQQPGHSWRDVLGLQVLHAVTRDDILRAYRLQAALHHPDRGGSDKAMAALNVAYEQALREVPA